MGVEQKADNWMLEEVAAFGGVGWGVSEHRAEKGLARQDVAQGPVGVEPLGPHSDGSREPRQHFNREKAWSKAGAVAVLG